MTLVEHSRVRVIGLSNAKTYNGLRATVRSISEEERVLIQLDKDGKQLKVKPENLELLNRSLIQELSVSELKQLLQNKREVNLASVTEREELLQLADQHCSTQEIIDVGKITTTDSSASSASAQAQALSEQMKTQRDMLKNNPHLFANVVAQNPQFQGKSFDDVMRHLNMLADTDPEKLLEMWNLQSKFAPIGGNYNDTQESLSEMQPGKLSELMKAQRDMLKNNPELFEQITQMNPQLQGKTLDEVQEQLNQLADMNPTQLAMMIRYQQNTTSRGPNDANLQEDMQKMMEKMPPEEISSMMKTQRDMLNKNPQMLESIIRQNPHMRGMTREQVIAQLDAMAEMDPARLSMMLKAAERIHRVTEPVRKAYAKLDEVTNGRANFVLLFLLGLIISFVLQQYFF